jgi:hypothetical protein
MLYSPEIANAALKVLYAATKTEVLVHLSRDGAPLPFSYHCCEVEHAANSEIFDDMFPKAAAPPPVSKKPKNVNSNGKARLIGRPKFRNTHSVRA